MPVGKIGPLVTDENVEVIRIDNTIVARGVKIKNAIFTYNDDEISITSYPDTGGVCSLCRKSSFIRRGKV